MLMLLNRLRRRDVSFMETVQLVAVGTRVAAGKSSVNRYDAGLLPLASAHVNVLLANVSVNVPHLTTTVAVLAPRS